jgi:hypothetical protein
MYRRGMEIASVIRQQEGGRGKGSADAAGTINLTKCKTK